MRNRRVFTTILAGGGVVVTPPAQPTGLSATPASTSQINLAWTDNATNETAYKVYRSTDGVNYAQVGTDLAADTQAYNDTTITAGVIYYYKVAAVNTGGETLSDAKQATTLTLNLIDVYKLDETSGNRLDSVGSRHLVPQGTVGYAAGKLGNCATFAGGATNHLLSNSDASLLEIDWSAGFSVVGWVYVPTTYTAPVMLLAKEDGGTVDWVLYVNTMSSLRFLVNDSVTGNSAAINTTTINVDTWYFFAGRYNPSTKKAEFSLNAGAWSLGNALTNVPKNVRVALVVNRFGSSYGAGQVDNCELWTRYITDEEVTALYNSGAGLVHP